jgi:uncharacterized coiled-coil protein SlyX
MKHKSEKLELRVMELEDTVALLSRIIHTMNQMLGNLNQITAKQTDMISEVIAALPEGSLPCPSPNPQNCGSCANDDDTPPWTRYHL